MRDILIREKRMHILRHSRKLGYRLHRINEWSYVLKRVTESTGTETINIYWNSKNRLFTFMSAIDHPKRGKTQLVRKYMDVVSVIELLSNSRKHTGRGYYEKK